ncbi:MAG: hypothetical protein RR199_07945, partial [Alistipes sp.]
MAPIIPRMGPAIRRKRIGTTIIKAIIFRIDIKSSVFNFDDLFYNNFPISSLASPNVIEGKLQKDVIK